MTQSTRTEYTLQSCLEACSRCHQVCLRTAQIYCLQRGEMHDEADLFRLLMDCAEICQTSARFQLASSRFVHRVCATCAEICDACAEQCEMAGGMDECGEVCRDCARSCRELASIPDHAPNRWRNQEMNRRPI